MAFCNNGVMAYLPNPCCGPFVIAGAAPCCATVAIQAAGPCAAAPLNLVSTPPTSPFTGGPTALPSFAASFNGIGFSAAGGGAVSAPSTAAFGAVVAPIG